MIKDPWFDNEKKNAFPSNFVWNTYNNIDESEILPDPFNSSTEIGSFLKDFEFQPSRAPASTSSLEDVDEVMARFSIFRKKLNELKKRKRSSIKNQPNSTKSKDNKVISSNKKKQTFFDKFKQSLDIRQESLDDEREEKEAIEEQEKREKIRESFVRDQKLKAKKEKAEKKEKIKSKKLQDLVNLINKHYEGRENPYSEYAKNSLPFLLNKFDKLIDKFGNLDKSKVEQYIRRDHDLSEPEDLSNFSTLSEINISEKIKTSINNCFKKIGLNNTSLIITNNLDFFQKGINYFENKNYEEAKKVFLKILHNTKTPEDHGYSLSHMVAISKDIEIHEHYLKNVHKLIEISLINFFMGEILLVLKNYEDACSYYAASFSTNPYFSIPYFKYAQSLIEKNELGESFLENTSLSGALPYLDEAIKIQKEIPDFYALRGLIRFLLSDYELSIADYKKASELSPHNADFLSKIAFVSTYIFDDKQSLSYSNKVLTLAPNHEEALYTRAISNLRLKNYSDATSDFSKVIDLHPYKTLGFYGRGSTKLRCKDYLEAIEDFSKIIELNQLKLSFPNETNDPFYKRNLRKIFCELDLFNEFGGIDDDFDGANFLLKKININIIALYQRGHSYAHLGNYEKAINDFLEVQRFDKTFANVDCQLKRISKYVLFSRNSKKTDEKFEQKELSLSLNRINLEDFEKSSIKNFVYYGVDDFCSPLKDYLSVNSLKKVRFTNKTKLNKEKKYSKLLNYHLKDFNDFYSFAEIIKNIPTRRQKRSFQELTNLINFIQEKKINLYLIKNDNENFLGSYWENSNSIVINAAYPFDLDLMCSTLTHELIHYFQFKKGNHLGLEIADETVNLCRLKAKEKLITDFEFRIELEANTYDGVKDFIFNYSKNKSKTIKKYSITEKRDKTIDWVCKSKMLPIYFESSNPKKVIDFSSQNK